MLPSECPFHATLCLEYLGTELLAHEGLPSLSAWPTSSFPPPTIFAILTLSMRVESIGPCGSPEKGGCLAQLPHVHGRQVAASSALQVVGPEGGSTSRNQR